MEFEKLLNLRLDTLSLNESTFIGDDEIKYLLSENVIGDNQMKHLSESLICGNLLKDLRLINNNISIEGIKHLGQALKQNTSLKSLSLRSCGIKSDKFNILIESLIYNKSLTSLDLANDNNYSNFCNNITNKDLESLLNMLQDNYSLTTIYLSANGYGLFVPHDSRIYNLSKLASPFEKNFIQFNILLRRNRKYKDNRSKAKKLLLLTRAFCKNSFFYKDYLPLDLFKIIYNDF